MAFRRNGVPIRYTTKPMGSKPYSTKVMMAPRTLPCELKASAKAISKVT
jgi:hypothetical protein